MIPTIFIEASVGAAAVAIVGGIVAGINSLYKMQRDVRRLTHMDTLRAVDLEQVAKVQRPMLSGLKASLEAHRDGKCNGNVLDAHTDITAAIDNYDLYLATLVRRGR